MYQYQTKPRRLQYGARSLEAPPASRIDPQPQASRQADGPMTVEECKNYINQKIIPNFRYQRIEHDTAGDIDQFNASRVREDLKPKPEPSFTENVFENKRVIPPNRIWHKNKDLDSRAVANTFKYIFHKFKKGIFIRIADNKLQTFLPFENAHYKNEFGHILKVDPKYGSVQDFLKHVSKLAGYKFNKQNTKPFDEWVANNSLVRYEVEQDTTVAVASGNNKITLRDMFRTLCDERDVPDIEFFINRRDYPQMKVDDTEPYNHIWGTKHQPLVSHQYDKYAPILSGSSTKMHADIPFPTYEDWARATYQKMGLVFPNACREYPDIISLPWSKKIEKAVFRGASTGSGVTADTNQRLKALEMGTKHEKLLDVGITKWNLRPRKLEGSSYLQTIERSNYKKANRLNLQEQSKYKYILTLEGHVAAYRLSYELSSGSVVLLAGSQWQMWYYPFLKEYEHYVPVKEDLSDLIAQIEWCKVNDGKCEQIAKNARAFYNKYLGTRGILDFLQKELWELSTKTKPYKYLPDLTIWAIEDEERQLFDELKNGSSTVLKFTNTTYNYPLPNSPRCVGVLDAMLKVIRSKSINDLAFRPGQRGQLIFENVNGIIDKYIVNGVSVVGKRANHRGKTLEHMHESYIGLKAVNKLVARTPNFAYVFGPLKDAQDMVFVEFIEGVSLMNWLKSPQYNFEDFLSILVQLNLALSVAQNYVGFIHYDLYPWNVMVQSSNNMRYYSGNKEGQQAFTYFLNFQKTSTGERKQNVVTLKQPNVIPVMIDYGKSRAIVHEPKYGTIDHGFANLYQHNSIIDTLTILYGSLNVLNDRYPNPNKIEMKLLDFPRRLGLESPDDIKRWGKFGALFDFKPKTKTGANATPKTFVDFVMKTFKTTGAPKLLQSSEFAYPMEKGVNPVIAEGFMMHGDKNAALLEMIKHVDRSRPPVSDDKFFQLVILNILQRRIGWIEDEMATGSNDIKKKWAIVRKLLFTPTQVKTPMPEMDFPKPKAMYLDDEMTPEYVEHHSAEVMRSETVTNQLNRHEDWMMTWVLCLEAYLFGVVTDDGDYGQFIGLDGFLYHNALASNNTLIKMRDMLLVERSSFKEDS